MDVTVSILLLILAIGSLAASVYYGVVLYRVIRAGRTVPTARRGLDVPAPEGGWPSLCIVVPAHNEEDVIGELIDSLCAQDYPDLHVVLALDRCTDATETLARARIDGDDRFEIVTIEHCPDDWAGKVHAAHQGVMRSRGAAGAALLLFTDADTVFDPTLCRASVGLMRERDLSMLSLLSQLTTEHWYERIVQPAATFELIREYPLDVINRAERPRAFANGQFMLFTREIYDDIGGHERVHDRLLEDLAFARELTRRREELGNPRWGVFVGAGLLRCKMYRSWDAFRRGWKRIFTEAAGRRPGHLRKWSRRQWLTGGLLPPVSMLATLAGVLAMTSGWDSDLGLVLVVLGALGVVSFTLAMIQIYAQQGIALGWIVLFPVGTFLSASIQAEAGRDLTAGRKTVWGGREYAREARS